MVTDGREVESENHGRGGRLRAGAGGLVADLLPHLCVLAWRGWSSTLARTSLLIYLWHAEELGVQWLVAVGWSKTSSLGQSLHLANQAKHF